MKTLLVSLFFAAACTSPLEPPRASSAESARLRVDDAEGVPRERVEKIFARAPIAVQRCAHGTEGKISLRVSTRDGALHVDVLPGAALDQSTLDCARDALRAIYDEENASTAGGPNVPPSGFTSIVTVSW